MTPTQKTKIVFALILGGYVFSNWLTPIEWHFLDNVHIIFHEAGHTILYPFGQFLRISGGTLGQILIPIICCLYFYFRNEKYSASIILLWLADSLRNVALYAGDAVRMQLPLLGGDNVVHDWNYMLTRLHLLLRTEQIAEGISLLALFFIVAGVGLAIREAYKGEPMEQYAEI